MNRPARDLTEGGIIRNIWYLALPMMGGNLLQNAFNIVDTIFVGKLGPSAIAAVGMSGIILHFVFVIIIGISTGTVALVARFIGAKKVPEAEQVAMQSLLLGVFCYAVVVALGYPLAPLMLRALGAAEEVVVPGTTYMRIIFIGAFTMILSMLAGAVLRAAGDAITPLKILVVSTLLNIGLDPLLIFGLWGFPRLGVAGSALATAISRGIGAGILLWIVLRGRTIVRFRIAHVRVDFSMMGRIVRIGIFASVQAILRNLGGVVLTRLVAVYGTFAVAAYVVGMRLQMIVMMPGFALAMAVSTLVGQNLGANKPERAEQTAWITTGLGFGIMTFCGVLYIVFAPGLIRVFNAHPDVVRIGTRYLYILAGTLGFIGLSIILGRALNGAGDTLSPMVITGIGLLVLRLGFCLLFSWKLDLMGIWFGVAASTVIQGVMMGVWFRRGRWKVQRV